MKTNTQENRIGRFRVADAMNWTDLMDVMANFVVIKCDYRPDLLEFEYIAFSPLFDVIPVGTEAPLYDIVSIMDGEKRVKVTAIRSHEN